MSTLLSAGALVGALSAVTASSGYSGVAALVLCFTSTALYLLHSGVGFLGYAYLLVYVGAIAILLLFAVMLSSAAAGLRPLSAGGYTAALLSGGAACCAALLGGLPVLPRECPLASLPLPLPGREGTPAASSAYLLECLPETAAAAAILLLAMCGAVALAKDG